MPGTSKPEESLISLADRIQAGDSEAEDEFVHMFQRRVRAFALANGADEPLADELVQDTLWGVIGCTAPGDFAGCGAAAKVQGAEEINRIAIQAVTTCPAAPTLE